MIETSIGGSKAIFPENISELILGQFLDLREAELKKELSEVRMISILGGIDYEILNELPATVRVLKQIEGAAKICNIVYQSIAEFNNSIVKADAPKTVRLLNTDYKVPQDLRRVPFGAIMTVKRLIKTDGIDITSSMDEVIAHFMYESVTECPYDEYRADDLKVLIRELPFELSVKLFNFFFLQHLHLFLPIQKRLPIYLRLMKNRLIYRFSMYMETLTLWMQLRTETLPNGMR